MRLNNRGRQIMDEVIADVRRAQQELERARDAARQQKGVGFELWDKQFSDSIAKYEAGIRRLSRMRNS